MARPEEFAKWSRGHPELPHRCLSRGDMATLRTFRKSLMNILCAAVRGTFPSARSLGLLNTAIHRSVLHRGLAWEKGAWVLRVSNDARSPMEQCKTAVARSAVELLVGPSQSKLRVCKGAGCAHFLLTRTRTQIWCSSTGCGNRARVSRHYWKERAEDRART